jgi:hypothetical protein
MEEASPGNHRKRRALLIAATLIGIVVVLGAFALLVVEVGGNAIVHAVIVGKTGPVTDPSDWPEPLQKLCKDLGATSLPTSTIQVHCLCRGMDAEYVWRMDAVPGLFEDLEKRWQLLPVSNPKWRVLSGRSSLSGESVPRWWSPGQGDGTTFHECPATRAGEKGDRFCVAFDKHQGVIFVHYWFNF